MLKGAYLLLAVLPVAPSTSAPPRADKEIQQAAPKETNSTSYQQAPDNAPVVIKIENTNNGSEKPTYRSDKQQENRSQGWNTGDKIGVIASVVAFLQLCALIMTVTVMYWAAKRQLRAYITVHDVRIQSVLGGWEATIVIKNSGMTPATNVETWSETDILPMPLPTGTVLSKLVASVLPPAKSVIASQGTTTLTSVKPTPTPAPPSLATRDAVYVYGLISYKDIFGKSHRTSFRMYQTGGMGPVMVPRYAHEGNDMK